MNPYTRLSAAAMKSQPATAAKVLEDYSADNVARFLAAASPATAGQVIDHFTPGFAAHCLAALEPVVAGRIYSQLLPDRQLIVLRQLEHDRRESLLQTLQPEQVESIRRLLPYPDGTAGAVMEAPLASVPEGLSVRNAIKRVKRIQRGMKFYLYATNAGGQLAGVLTLHELINTLPSSSVSQVMHRHVVSLSPLQSIAAVLDSPYWQDYHALPVTDENDVLLGVIRLKTLHRLQELALRSGNLGDGLDTFMAVGELFSRTALDLLAAMINTGTAIMPREPHD
jgi:magnesium transporter